jgi:hypothetical protein
MELQVPILNLLRRFVQVAQKLLKKWRDISGKAASFGFG